MTSQSEIGIGVLGLGRTGWQNHCRQLATLSRKYRIVAVADPDTTRQQQAAAEFACRAYATPEALFADPEIELATIATPSNLHLSHVLAALSAGKHVVCEKPLAGSVEDVDRMIHAAEQAGRVLTVFQNYRFAPDFLQVRKVIDSGVLGRIVQIRVAIHSYKRRWDWQTLRQFNGGELNNTASHYIDAVLQLLDAQTPDVFGYLGRTLSCGDAEDHTNLIMRAPGCPLVQVETSNAAAIEQERWLVLGTHGALAGSGLKLRWRTSNLAALPPREADPKPTPDRSYNREKYEWQEQTWERPADAQPESIPFYEALFATLREGAPLAVTPQSVRRQIDVLSRCRASAGQTIG